MVQSVHVHIKEIEKGVTKAIQKENKAYCSGDTIKYSLKEASKIHEKIANDILRSCKIKNPLKVLDAGCGFGDLAFALSKNAKKVCGIDPNKGFIALCKKKKECLKSDNTEFFVAPCEKLPFPKNTFDIVVSKTVLEHVDNVKKTISEMARVAKPSGIVYIECPNYMWIKEGHYNVYMFPLMPKVLFKAYLKIRGKDTSFINHIKYVTPEKVLGLAKKSRLSLEKNVSLEILSDILIKKEFRKIPKHYKKIGTLIKITSIMGLNRIMFWLIQKTSFYPSIVMIFKKK